jgi:hypothetical protein
MKLNSITDVMGDQLGDLRSAEQQLIEALPKMADAATDSELKSAFSNHYEQTKGHFRRLQEIIGSVDFGVPLEDCEAMKGLIAEGEKVIKAEGDPDVRDVALIDRDRRTRRQRHQRDRRPLSTGQQPGVKTAHASEHPMRSLRESRLRKSGERRGRSCRFSAGLDVCLLDDALDDIAGEILFGVLLGLDLLVDLDARCLPG